MKPEEFSLDNLRLLMTERSKSGLALPIRLVANKEYRNMGTDEFFGESKIVESARGDLVVLETLRRFNELYSKEPEN